MSTAREFAHQHAAAMAADMTDLCGKVIAKGMQGILEACTEEHLIRKRLERALDRSVTFSAHEETVNHFQATIENFREHYLRAIECNEETHQDKPHCACSSIDLGWHPSVGQAVDAWHAHVLKVAAVELGKSAGEKK